MKYPIYPPVWRACSPRPSTETVLNGFFQNVKKPSYNKSNSPNKSFSLLQAGSLYSLVKNRITIWIGRLIINIIGCCNSGRGRWPLIVAQCHFERASRWYKNVTVIFRRMMSIHHIIVILATLSIRWCCRLYIIDAWRLSYCWYYYCQCFTFMKDLGVLTTSSTLSLPHQ